MYKMGNVDIIYRLICFVVFSIVILFVGNIVSLLLLLLFLILGSFREKNPTFPFLYLLCIIAFIGSFYSNIYLLIKIMLIISYLFYFINVTRLNIVFNKNSVSSVKESDKDYIRFKNSKEDKDIIKNTNFDTTIYVTAHFLFLFLSIMVGVL